MKKKKLKKFANEEVDIFVNDFDDNESSVVDSITNDFDETNLDSLKNAIIEISGEGSRLTGKIFQVKETKNSVIIMFRSKWGDIEELNLYFDEFDELKNNKRVSTMDGEVSIK